MLGSIGLKKSYRHVKWNVYNTIQGKKNILLFVTLVLLFFEQITCLDITSGGGLGVSSSTDGSMKIWQAANGELRVKAF